MNHHNKQRDLDRRTDASYLAFLLSIFNVLPGMWCISMWCISMHFHELELKVFRGHIIHYTYPHTHVRTKEYGNCNLLLSKRYELGCQKELDILFNGGAVTLKMQLSPTSKLLNNDRSQI